MHVLITTDTLGGVWTYTQELATGLVRRGVRVTLVSFGEIPSQEQTLWMDGLANLDFRPTGFPLEWMQEGQPDIPASREFLESVVRETNPDVLHLNQFCYGGLEVPQPRIVVGHSDVISWWLAVHGAEPPETSWLRWYREAVQRGLQAADLVVAPSGWMLAKLHSLYGYLRNSQVIYNGRDPKRFNGELQKEDLAISMGRIWDSGKQVTLLCRNDLPMQVIIAGVEEHPEKALRNSAHISSALPKLRFLGRQNEAQVRQLLARASVYVATSRYEPFGLAPLEAALSGCALLMNDLPVFRELWGDSACYFQANDAQSLIPNLGELHRDRSLRQQFATRAYHRARSRFTTDNMVENYLQLYTSLTAAPALAA